MSADERREAISCHVARILKEARQKQGLSMDALARKAGLSQAMISFVERGIRNPSLDTLLRITDVLNLNLGTVIGAAYKITSTRGG